MPAGHADTAMGVAPRSLGRVAGTMIKANNDNENGTVGTPNQ